MDPNAALKEIRELCEQDELDDYDALRLRDLVDGLINWLDHGGFLPSDWQR